MKKEIVILMLAIAASIIIGKGIIVVTDFVEEQRQIEDYVTSITENIQNI
jgi:hypothetical protein